MRLSLTHKYVGSLFSALITCCAVVLFVSIYYMKKPIDEELSNSIHRMQNIVHSANEMTIQRFAQNAAFIATNDRLARAMAYKDHDEVFTLAEKAMKMAGSDFMSVTDAQGIVIARGHSKSKFGDSIAKQETVAKAMQGVPAQAVVTGPLNPFTLRASQPVLYEGQLVGTISIGVSLTAPDYLDWLSQLAGAAVTIFKGDTRVMTTIVSDSKRAVGTKLEAPDVIDAVLERGETVFVQNTILGVPYQSAYWPVKAADGKIVGMWFTGAPIGELKKLENEAIVTAVSVAAALLLVQLGISVFVGLRVSAPVRKITSYALEVADGKQDSVLTVRGSDDMGMLADALRSMEKNLRTLVFEAAEKAREAEKCGEECKLAMNEAEQAKAKAEQARCDGMSSAAARIEEVAVKLGNSVSDIAEQVENTDVALSRAVSRLAEIASAMEEMNSTVLAVARNAGGAADISDAARNLAETGSSVVSQAVSSIQQVQQQSLGLKGGMTLLDEHARAISRIMSVISDIADQTNLLALNAAIEAARAGDAGRGFAVVADEVRKLAEKTMTSTTDVGDAIRAIQSSAAQSIQQVDEAVNNISVATEYSNKSGQSLQEIVGMVDKTADEVRAIATASEQQSAVSDEINKSISDVNYLTGNTSESMKVALRELDELRHQTQSLMDLVEALKKS
ncbi:methyl-accepting chemotaxis protein [Desulfovibrio falkowii]|uniref:Methyl-accepting chemotaxis sensory transducer n=3 Tax=Desulfovibrio TaxID=872 RepID=B8IZC2_DESDA|nr:methyl-accepting chemotaxis protein [uncultured Desulfovibrio sp.]MDY0204377.1 methyl-accepting chemotaxis protein [Desulfovibrio desulfuricans]